MEEWLADLGIGEYVSCFAENKIDFSILSELTDQDLKELGITAMGDRRKLLRVVAALATEPVVSSTNVSKPGAIRGNRKNEQLLPRLLANGDI